MTESEIYSIVEKQRNFFYSGKTLELSFRIHALNRLYTMILKHQAEIQDALRKDLGKSCFESYMCEIGLTLSEITYMLKHIHRFTKEKTVPTPLSQFHSRSYQKPSPYGVVLIMSPWNYPFLLTLEPLVDALAAGNTAILKPSAYSPCTSDLLCSLIRKYFPEQYVAIITGGREENTSLLNQHFDYIFFTGSQTVGKEVMKSASSHLTPVTLELGGKSPCIVDRTANIKLAARRIVFGKFLNCGQTCVAPDYIYCHREIKEELIQEITKQIRKQYGKNPIQNKNYGKIINKKHFSRLQKLMDSNKIVYGGSVEECSLKIEPTVMDNITFDDPIMQQEIFGPILPILTYDSLDSAIRKINSMAHPLALYIFSESQTVIHKVTSRCGFGGGCVNDTLIHLATSEMGFGGFGESGIGAYHGKEGFMTFSHYKSIVDKKTWIDLPVRYQPYHALSSKLLHLLLK